MKQLEEDPFSNYVALNERGAIVTGRITEVEPKQALVELAEDVQAVLKASEISIDRVEDARNLLNVGDEIEVKIVSVDRKIRSMGVSVKAKDQDDEAAAVREHKERDEEVSPTTIGDLIKQKLEGEDQ